MKTIKCLFVLALVFAMATPLTSVVAYAGDEVAMPGYEFPSADNSSGSFEAPTDIPPPMPSLEVGFDDTIAVRYCASILSEATCITSTGSGGKTCVWQSGSCAEQ